MPWAQTRATNNEKLTTLDSLHEHFNNTALSNAIIELQQSYYGKNPSQWSGKNLMHAIQEINKQGYSGATNAQFNLNP